MLKKSNKKIDKSKKADNDDINYKKLFFELMFVLTVAFGITIACLAPYIKDKNAHRDKYERYREIIAYVDNYDYSKGRNLEYEKDLDRKVKEAKSDEESHFYVLASAIYYCNAGLYRIANGAFSWLESYAIDDVNEQLDIEAREVICQRKYSKEGRYE